MIRSDSDAMMGSYSVRKMVLKLAAVYELQAQDPECWVCAPSQGSGLLNFPAFMAVGCRPQEFRALSARGRVWAGWLTVCLKTHVEATKDCESLQTAALTW